ncbi:MAG: class I SAM-dependent methyltransferase [Candidatus Altiarchaeota archaeon]
MPENYREYYGRFAGDLDERAYYGRLYVQRYWQREKISKVVEDAGVGKLLLDLGSGSGVISNLLSESNTVISYDISENCIRNCRKINKNLMGVVGDAINLPFKEKSFDAVVCVELIEHLTSPQKCVAEIRRTLNDKGNLILTTPNFRSMWPMVEFLWDTLGKGRGYRKQHISKFDKNGLKKILEDNGMRVKKMSTILLVTPFTAVLSEKLTKLVHPAEERLLKMTASGMLLTVVAEKEDGKG